MGKGKKKKCITYNHQNNEATRQPYNPQNRETAHPQVTASNTDRTGSQETIISQNGSNTRGTVQVTQNETGERVENEANESKSEAGKGATGGSAMTGARSKNEGMAGDGSHQPARSHSDAHRSDRRADEQPQYTHRLYNYQGSQSSTKFHGHQYQRDNDPKWQNKDQYEHQNYHNYNSHQQPRNAQQQNQATKQSRWIECAGCDQMYNLEDRLPRVLYCGHSMCTSCMANRRNCWHEVPCAECKVNTYEVLNVKAHPVNHSLLKLLPEKDSLKTDKSEGEKNSDNSHEISCNKSFINDQKVNSGNKPTVTVTGSSEKEDQKECYAQTSNRRPELPLKSPHSSKCLEMGVPPKLYCVKCKQWVCKKCADIDHTKKGSCALAPPKDALTDMKRQHENTASATTDSLTLSLKELERHDSQLEMYSMIMRAAFECIGKKQEHIQKTLQDGKQVKKELEAKITELPNKKNVHDALAQFQSVDDQVSIAHQWMSDEAGNIGNVKIEKSAKDILSILCEYHWAVKRENGTSNELFVSQELPTGRILSELKLDGGRILFNSLTPIKNVSKGSRLLPLECIMACLNKCSTLAFLDLSWGGSHRGRVYVRLTGDTQRGRQFVRLCTGETGSCFRSTRFHRVWWKNLPGEHIWTGDYKKNDGSGDQTLVQDDKEWQTPTQIGRQCPIYEGLVAGRYEKDYISSIFRIYTREAKDVDEEAAFGQVEFGLDVVKEATKLKDITNVTIEDCGIVLEV